MAQAAEPDDLVSVFQAVCMTSGTFSDSLRDFAQAHGWTVKSGLNGTSHSAFSPRKVTTRHPAPADWTPALHVSLHLPHERIAGSSLHGQPKETCWVSEPGLNQSQVEVRMRPLPEWSAANPIAHEVMLSFGREGPEVGSPQWKLPSATWDYVVLFEGRHMMDTTNLVRLRPYRSEKP